MTKIFFFNMWKVYNKKLKFLVFCIYIQPGYLAITPIVLACSFFNVIASLVSNAYPYLDNKDPSFIISCVMV